MKETFKGTNEEWKYVKSTSEFYPYTISRSGRVIGYCVTDSEEDRANEKLRASALELLNALTAITENIERWLESGEPADEKESKRLYDNAKKAITRALF